MSERIKLVQGDTRPQLIFSITDETTGNPVDVSGAASILLHFREAGAATVKESLPCFKLAGLVQQDGTVLLTAPYDVPGVGGRVAMDWTDTALDRDGSFEGELEITFSDGSVQTVFDVLRFQVRPQIQ